MSWPAECFVQTVVVVIERDGWTVEVLPIIGLVRKHLRLIATLPHLSLYRFLNEMSDVNFRKIDIDVYDEDALVETELYDADPRDPTQALNDAKQRATAVRSALSK